MRYSVSSMLRESESPEAVVPGAAIIGGDRSIPSVRVVMWGLLESSSGLQSKSRPESVTSTLATDAYVIKHMRGVVHWTGTPGGVYPVGDGVGALVPHHGRRAVIVQSIRTFFFDSG